MASGSDHPQNTITLTGSGSAAGPADDVTIPRELGPVRLLREIGRGGMGVVYLGRHQMLDRDVAVKFLLHAVAGADDPGFARFLDGARAAARLEHPGLTTIHHADVVDGIPYLVMQYVDGPALSDVLKRTGPLSVSASFAVLNAVSEAIGELHDRGIIHRDIKPGNVLLSPDGRVVVTDFGLSVARPLGQRGPSSVGLAGTPSYMAPEMFAGEVSLRSDVYALGVMTFELLTGELPFAGTVEEVREKHLHEPLPLELLQRRRLDPALIDVLARAMHKDAMFRYKTAEYLRKAMQGGLATEELLREGAAELQRLVLRTLEEEPNATTTQAAETTPTTTYFDRLSEIANEKRATREPTGEAALERPAQKDRAEATPLPPGDQPVEVGPIPGPPSAEPTQAATLVADVPCVKCDYNLRGLSADGRCPECGEAVVSSLRPDRLVFADRTWLTRIARGLTLIYTTMTAIPVVFVLFFVLGAFFSLGPGAVIGGLMFVGLPPALLFVALGAVFSSTAPEPRRSRRGFERTSRQAVRAFALFLALVSILITAIGVISWAIPSADLAAALGGAMEFIGAGTAEVYFLLFLAPLSGLAVSLLLHLATLADRIPDRRLARRSRVLTVVFIALLILGVADLAAVWSFDLVGIDSAGEWVSMVVALLCIVGESATILLIWVLMRLYRKAFKQSIAASVSYETLFGDVPTEVALPTSENDRPATREPTGEAARERPAQENRAEATPLPPGDEPVEVGSIPGPTSADPTQAATLVADVPCVKCDYNLRGLSADGRCPECGEAVVSSLRPDRLMFADRTWLTRIARGLTMIYIAVPAVPFLVLLVAVTGTLLAAFVLGPVLSFWSDVGTSMIVGMLVGLLAGLSTLVLGVFYSTAAEPQQSRGQLRRRTRWVVRILAVLFVSTLMAAVALGMTNRLVPRLGWVLNAGPFSGLVVSFLLHLSTLGNRIPDLHLARRCRYLAMLLGLFVILNLAMPGELATYVGNRTWFRWTISAIGATSGIAMGVTIVWIWVHIGAYRRGVKRAVAASVSYETLFGDVPTEVALPTSENDRPATRSPTGEAVLERPAREDRAEATPLPPGDQPVEVGPIPGPPSAEPAGAATLVADVSCVKCDYNLRSLSAGGRCPECGEAVASSLNPDRLMFADRAWLGRLVRGQTLIFAGTTAFALLFLGWVILTALGVVGGDMPAVLEIGVYAPIIAGIVGVFFSTAGHPQRFRGSHRRTRCWVPRAFGVLFITSAIAHDIIDAYANVPVIIVVFKALIATFALGLVASFLLHLASLADCIPDRQLARRSRVLTVALSALVILGVVVWTANRAFGGVMGAIPAWARPPVTIILIILIVGTLLTIGLIWAQMWLSRKGVKRVIAAGVSYETLFGDVPTEVALPTSENDRAPTRSPRVETGDTGGESSDVDEVPSSDDIPCIHCGYNLRGLPGGGRCPECGTAMARSLRGDLLSAADPHWLQRVSRGQALVYAGCVALVTHLFLYNVSSGGVSLGSWIVVKALRASSVVDTVLEAFLSAAVALLLLLGAFRTTTLDPRLSLTEQPIALRRFVRLSIVALVALAGCSYLAPTVVTQLGVDAEAATLCGTVFAGASLLAFLSGLVGICYYLADLAMRIPDAKLATRTKSKVVRFVVCVGILYISLVTKYAGTALAANPLLSLVLIPILILALVSLVYIFSLMNLMSTYRKAFRKSLLEARKHPAG